MHPREVRLLLLAALVAIATGVAAALQLAPPGQQLNPRIGPPAPARYEAVREAQDWLNPYLQVCADGVHLTVHSIKRKSLVAIRDLGGTLVKLPVEAWPYGRVAALQECSVGVPGDTEVRRRRLVEVEAVLKALRLEVTRWPS